MAARHPRRLWWLQGRIEKLQRWSYAFSHWVAVELKLSCGSAACSCRSFAARIAAVNATRIVAGTAAGHVTGNAAGNDQGIAAGNTATI